MNGAFYVGATGLQAQQRALDVVANNISNINTTGFKRSEIRFSELVSQVPQREAREAREAPPVQLPESLAGVQARTTVRIYEQGNLRQTGQQFDLAISGDGFIETLGPGGEIWMWRGGTLRVNADRLLETEGGLLLKSQIEVPEDSIGIEVSREGVVSSITAGSQERVELGVIDLVMPRDQSLVEAVGAGFYRLPQGNNEVETLLAGEEGGVIVQGSVETSNVELTTEIVSLLLLQRAYGANAQVVQAGDQLMSISNNLRR